ncbi:MAG: polysaccharide deacetylase family protein [Bacteroidales bacterium]|nr:polysaccharide deacetylase family protein [Bacteroidales bacterium]
MIPSRTPIFLKKLYYSLIWNIPNKNNEIYLTFDDGPTPEITPEVLAILKQYKAKATFFCIGKNAEQHPEIYKQIQDSGHTIGNHTYSHLKGWKTKNQEYFNDIKHAQSVIPSVLFRPPYGKIKRSQLKKLINFYKIIMWDVLSQDYDANISNEKCLQNVIQNTRSGSIIVFHDSVKASERMLYALPKVLEYFSEKNFVFNKIG